MLDHRRLLATHSLLLIGRGGQQDEGEDHGKAADGVQLAVWKRGAQLVSGAFFCKRQNLKNKMIKNCKKNKNKKV